jgi:hypothetical protein
MGPAYTIVRSRTLTPSINLYPIFVPLIILTKVSRFLKYHESKALSQNLHNTRLSKSLWIVVILKGVLYGFATLEAKAYKIKFKLNYTSINEGICYAC